MKHLEKLIEILEERGDKLTPEQLAELALVQAEIDALYEAIIANQLAFGVQSYFIPRDGNEPYIPDDMGGLNIIEVEED